MRRCAVCHGTNVQVLRMAWFDANTDEYQPDDYDADTIETWCDDCDKAGVDLEETEDPGICETPKTASE